jgi:hypothetical protein
MEDQKDEQQYDAERNKSKSHVHGWLAPAKPVGSSATKSGESVLSSHREHLLESIRLQHRRKQVENKLGKLFSLINLFFS